MNKAFELGTHLLYDRSTSSTQLARIDPTSTNDCDQFIEMKRQDIF